MKFLLDTNICSAYLKQPGRLTHRFTQHGGRLHLPSIVLAELFTWAYRRPDPSPLMAAIQTELLTCMNVVDFDSDCAEIFGRLRAMLMDQGTATNVVDLLIGSIAVNHGMTMVTANTSHFDIIPTLPVINWLA